MVRRSRFTTGLLLAAMFAVASTLTVASTFLKIDLPTLNRMSESVVHARVAEMHSAWNADGSMIFTDVTLEVLGRLRGTADSIVTVRVPGGTVGDFTSEMEGAPRFEEGEQVIVFLARWHDGVPMVAGYAEGLSFVHPDSAGRAVLHGGLADGLPMAELKRQLAADR
jgi:hypothetical protein